MAIAFVQGANSAGAVTGVVELGAGATASNVLVSSFCKNASVTEPTISDNINGSTGWTILSVKALNNVSGNSQWIAVRTATGGEKTITWTAGAGTAEGASVGEFSGCSTTLDSTGHHDNKVSSKTITGPDEPAKLTTTDAGSVVVAFVGLNSESVIEAWTTAPIPTNFATAATRCFGAYYLPGTTLSAATFTANWTTARTSGMIAIALKPSAGGGEPEPKLKAVVTKSLGAFNTPKLTVIGGTTITALAAKEESSLNEPFMTSASNLKALAVKSSSRLAATGGGENGSPFGNFIHCGSRHAHFRGRRL